MQKNRNRIINVGLFAGSIVALAGLALQAEDEASEGVVRIGDVSGDVYSTGHVPAHSAITYAESFDHAAGGVLSRRRSRGIFGWKPFTPFACLDRMLKRSWDHDLACKRYYFDRRDGSIHSAAGYGTPIAVPLAPNVSHTYNYGWGIPTSRLTPISTVSHR